MLAVHGPQDYDGHAGCEKYVAWVEDAKHTTTSGHTGEGNIVGTDERASVLEIQLLSFLHIFYQLRLSCSFRVLAP